MKKQKWIIRGLYLVFLAMVVIAIARLGVYYLGEYKNKDKSEKLAKDVIVWEKDDTKKQEVIVLPIDVESSKAPKDIKFDDLMSQNEDVVAWIFCDDTAINYPVVQTTDNDFYLRRGLDKQPNRDGSIFVDADNNSGFKDHNTIIYGHNMKSGNMFHDLELYKEQSFYDEHPEMYFYTPDHYYKIQLIAGSVIDGYDELYNLDKTIVEVDADIDRIIASSTFQSGVSYSNTDRLITLSTCSYEKDDARYVVVGRLIEWDDKFAY